MKKKKEEFNLGGMNVKTQDICPWNMMKGSCTMIQQIHSMDSEGKATAYIENSDKVCIATNKPDLIYDMVVKNKVLGIETIQQEINIPEVKVNTGCRDRRS